MLHYQLLCSFHLVGLQMQLYQKLQKSKMFLLKKQGKTFPLLKTVQKILKFYKHFMPAETVAWDPVEALVMEVVNAAVWEVALRVALVAVLVAANFQVHGLGNNCCK